MSNGSKIHGTSEGGTAGTHAPADPIDLLLGPTTSDQRNTAHLRLVPIACLRIDEIRFSFFTSFVAADLTDPKKDIRAELDLLVKLQKAHPESPLSVFGHADPIGIDILSKDLSGRMATVIYALLIANTDPDAAVKLWQGVSSQENWGAHQRQNMQAFTGLPASTPDNSLFKAYMQKLCPPELKVSKHDFLAQGADANGEADYQGCGEFNPVLIFSTKRNSELDVISRRDANAPNRRVMILLFKKGSKVDPAQWPCPRATEGADGCKKRLWSDGEKRRSTRLADKDRKFADKKDTFACRFYDRLITITNSPCETPLTIVKIRLYDAQARPLPFAPCLVTEDGKDPRPDRATGAPPSPLGSTPAGKPGSSPANDIEDGYITFRVTKLPTTVNLKWSRPKKGEGPNAPLPEVFKDTQKGRSGHQYFNGYKYEFEMDLTIDIPEAPLQAASKLRLKNLGYDPNPPKPIPLLDDPIRAFQHDYKPRFGNIAEDGTLNPATIEAIRTTHDDCDVVLKAGSDVDVKR